MSTRTLGFIASTNDVRAFFRELGLSPDMAIDVFRERMHANHADRDVIVKCEACGRDNVVTL